jgi:shikimate dehydrogenase
MDEARRRRISVLITGKTKLYYMLAHPIEHIRSPEVFNPLFEQHGIDAIMVPLHIHPEDYDSCWNTLRKSHNLGGFMVSVPLKEQTLHLCDESDELASEVGAANTVRREATGRMIAANFDGPGFVAGVIRDGRDAVGARVLLIGAGGAGASIAFSLAKVGVRSLLITDIDEMRADNLAAAVGARYRAIEVKSGECDLSDRKLIINATPCGLHPETDVLPVDVSQLRPDMIVADIIMKPKVTPLLAAAVKLGCDVRYGAGMLDMQAKLVMQFFGY